MSDTIAGRAGAAIRASVERVAGAALGLSRSAAYRDLLTTIDSISVMLGNSRSEPATEPSSANAGEVAAAIADQTASLMLPEYLLSAADDHAVFRVRLPQEARQDGLGELVDFLESLALETQVSHTGDEVRLAISVGGGDRPVLVWASGTTRIDIDLDLAAGRGALAHVGALLERFGAATTSAGLHMESLSGTLRVSLAAPEPTRFVASVAITESIRAVGRTEADRFDIGLGASEPLLEVDADGASGAVSLLVSLAGLAAQLPRPMFGDGDEATAYALERARVRLGCVRGQRSFSLADLEVVGAAVKSAAGGVRWTLGAGEGGAAVAELKPDGAQGEVVFVWGDGLMVDVDGGELKLAADRGTTVCLAGDVLQVREGRLHLAARRGGRLEVRRGKSLVRRTPPETTEAKDLLRGYEVR